MLVTRADQVAQSGNLEQLLDEIRFASAHQFNKITGGPDFAQVPRCRTEPGNRPQRGRQAQAARHFRIAARYESGRASRRRQASCRSGHISAHTCAAYAEAISYLTQQGRELSHRIASGDDIESDDLMQASADNITWLSEYLDDVSVKDDPVLEKARTRALDATELVQLMQFESNDDAGIEALSLVIQLKRDLQADIAQADHARPVKAA